MPRGSHLATLDFTNLTTEINHQRELVRKIQPPAKQLATGSLVETGFRLSMLVLSFIRFIYLLSRR